MEAVRIHKQDSKKCQRSSSDSNFLSQRKLELMFLSLWDIRKTRTKSYQKIKYLLTQRQIGPYKRRKEGRKKFKTGTYESFFQFFCPKKETHTQQFSDCEITFKNGTQGYQQNQIPTQHLIGPFKKERRNCRLAEIWNFFLHYECES